MAENGWSGHHVSRRDFLRYSLATSVAVWAGSVVPGGLGIGEAEARELFQTTAVNPGRFPQSVASGDPQPRGIVLWTRVQPPAGTAGTIRVGYRIALDDNRTDDQAFAAPVLSGVVETGGARDYTVKIQLRERAALDPSRKYRYRFYYGGATSKTGRFKTLPALGADVSRVRFGYISCQDYTNGYYNALYHLNQEDIDFVVHLGDYTYETVGSNSFQGGGPPERQFTFPDGGEEELTLRDYRFGYKKYKTDPNLQALHEKCAFITIWDDHEFANDCYQVFAPDQGGTDETPSKNPQRREAATRAWFEFNPVGVPYDAAKNPLNEITIYRSFAFGDLMELVMTDQRLYRDGPPSGNETQDRYLTPGTGEEEAAGRTMLGDGTPGVNGWSRPAQVDYFLNKVTQSARTWKLWGNEVTFMQFKLANLSVESEALTISSLDELFPGIESYPAAGVVGAPEGVYVTLDQWDGYQAERRRITQRVRDGGTSGPTGIENFITLTGDIHSYIAGYIKYDYDDRTCEGDNRPVGVELVCPSVTSSNLVEIATFGFGAAPAPDAGQFTPQVTANNPHIKYFNSSDHGYNLVEVTKASVLCTMKAVHVILLTTENRGSGIREENPQNTKTSVLRKFRVPARGTTFAGLQIDEPLIFDETSGVPVPLPCEASISPGPGGA